MDILESFILAKIFASKRNIFTEQNIIPLRILYRAIYVETAQCLHRAKYGNIAQCLYRAIYGKLRNVCCKQTMLKLRNVCTDKM